MLFLTIIFTIMVLISIIFTVYIITIPKKGEKFTEFYILNSTSGKADNYPIELSTNENATLLVGIVNHEYSVINYTLQIDLDKNILNSHKMKLDNGETWENNITFRPNKKGSNMILELLLFKENNLSIPYRELHLWVSAI